MRPWPARRWPSPIGASDGGGAQLTKQAIQAASDNGLMAQLDLERDLQAKAGRTHDFAEGIAAFLEKRKPEFRGA